jgi:pimeloyl-ACP methyl ester carboxylesterase
MNEATSLRRGWIHIRSGRVHYREAGRGDPVILIHQSPTSARTLDAQTLGFARAGFHAIAIDIPGLGRSDPLGLPQPEIGDQALALAEVLDALDLGRVALYGSHTGALICCELAVRAPDRVSTVLIDGYPIYTQGESERRVATYFPPFEMRWDGGHLLWLWARLREQYLFWPWNVPGLSTSARCDIPDPAFLTDGVIDMLRVGNDYRLPYAAAFRCAADVLISRIQVPTYHLAAPDDSLTQALGLLESMSEVNQVVAVSADLGERIAQEIALLERHRPGAATPKFERAGRADPAAGRLHRGYVDTTEAQLAFRSAGDNQGARPLLVLPPTPGSSKQMESEILALARSRPVIAIDLPGCGDSGEGFSDASLGSVPRIGELLQQAIRTLGLEEYDLYGLAGGANVALHLARTYPGARHVAIQSPVRGLPGTPDFAERYAPHIVPRPDGTHLISFWHQQRNRHLFRPWFDERLVARRNDIPGLVVDRLNEQVLAQLESWRYWHTIWRALLSDDPMASAQALGARVHHFEWHRDEFAAMSTRDAAITALPEALWARVEMIASTLGHRPKQ